MKDKNDAIVAAGSDANIKIICTKGTSGLLDTGQPLDSGPDVHVFKVSDMSTIMTAPEGSLPTFHGGALAPPRELGWGSSPQEAAVRFVRDGLHIQVQFRRKSTPGTTRTK